MTKHHRRQGLDDRAVQLDAVDALDAVPIGEPRNLLADLPTGGVDAVFERREERSTEQTQSGQDQGLSAAQET